MVCLLLQSYRLFIVMISATVLFACSTAKTPAYKSTIAPGYQRQDYQKVMVMARIDKKDYRKQAEDALVAALKNMDKPAINAIDHLDVGYAYDSTAFFKKLQDLGVDGMFVVAYLGEQTSVQDSWHYTGGVYQNYYGGFYAPFDLDTRSEKTGYVQVQFYPLTARTPQWSTIVPVSRSNGIETAMKQFAGETSKRIRMDKVL